jgi:hypothetical protein
MIPVCYTVTYTSEQTLNLKSIKQINMNGTSGALKERSEHTKHTANGHALTDLQYKQINERLEQICHYLKEELESKQRTFLEQRNEVERLQSDINKKTSLIANLQQQLQHSAQSTEGHRQLINKLLNDIEHYQNDIDWYKRTYERRSIWGVLKEKLTRRT